MQSTKENPFKWYFTRGWWSIVSVPFFALYGVAVPFYLYYGFKISDPLTTLLKLEIPFINWIPLSGFFTMAICFLPAICFLLVVVQIPKFWNQRKYGLGVAVFVGLTVSANFVARTGQKLLVYLADKRPCAALEVGVIGSQVPNCESANNQPEKQGQ